MGDFYNQWMYNDPRYMQMMQQRAAAGVPNYQLSTPSLTPNALQNIDPSATTALSTTPGTAATGTNWLGYAGLGASAAAPIAAAVLGRQKERPAFAPASSLGSKPMMQVDNIYGRPQQRIPAFLARLLMGAR